MGSYYDDNFGHWEDMDDPDMVDFYHQVQRESVLKKCADCGRPDYGICGACADRAERGGF
jgi:hypothetical protein